jgi:hypothetical protein
MREQPLLAVETTAVPGQRSIRADHPMAGHQDGNGIASVRESHRPRCIRIADMFRELTVAPRFSVGNLGERVPDALLEFGAFQA